MGAKQALSIRTGVQMTGSAAEIFAKKDVLRAAADFALAYNNPYIQPTFGYRRNCLMDKHVKRKRISANFTG